jgi:hypothetical protein
MKVWRFLANYYPIRTLSVESQLRNKTITFMDLGAAWAGIVVVPGMAASITAV